jgi:hypothetical protein
MSDETYYTVLNVKETASVAEIKTAYRDVIKQVHPDTIASLAPYLRKIAEDKTKEITEAYGVLSNSSKRREYDNQLAAYRQQNAPQAPPPPPAPQPTPTQTGSTSSFGFCNKCGASLYASGYCPKCSKFATPSTTTAKPAATRKVLRFGYNWGPILDWASEHPIMVVFLFVLAVFSIGAIFSDSNTLQSSTSSSSSASPTPFTNNAKAASTGPYSAYPCDFREKVSSIDGKPCKEKEDESVPAPPPGFTIDSNSSERHAASPTVTVSGTYVGTVHNQTVNTISTFTAVIHQAKDGAFDGCMEVKPPLYGRGALRGSIHGSHVNFVVADITFQGDASKSGITGSYVVVRQDGNQLGEFHLMKQTAAAPSYDCEGGVVTSSLTANHVPSEDKVVPTTANVMVKTPNAPATVARPATENRAWSSKQSDLSGLTSSEHQSIEAACSQAKYLEGPAAYDQCISRQLQAWTLGPRHPDLSGLTSSEHQSIEAACSQAKFLEGPAAYDSCLVRQLQAWSAGPKQPNLSGLTSSEHQSIEAACSQAKFLEGPAAYDRCLVRQLQALTNYRQ